jgi:ATP-dependent Clp protease ATP-binding subunit ClpC
VCQINLNLAAKEIKIRLAPEAAKYILEKTCNDRSFSARPAELQIFLGDAGIYCRQIKEGEGEAEEELVGAGAAATTPLFMF